jgi:hypothetical protein
MSRTHKSPHRPRCHLCHGPKLLGKPTRQELTAPRVDDELEAAEALVYDDCPFVFCSCCNEDGDLEFNTPPPVRVPLVFV